MHVTLRAIGVVGNLRRRCVYQAIREATLTTARREDFRICHLSIQHNHLHLIVEASNKRPLVSTIWRACRVGLTADSSETALRGNDRGRLQSAARRRTMRGAWRSR
ncbi:MAG TPA: hypothetical protein VLM79_14785 [Kofleriaceae bacterium]|nr:hypothetical protein [Kofleriaceae bacterium]